MRTYEERLVAGLIAKGWREVANARSGKYRTFENLKVVGGYLFVGKAGALRKGRCATQSFSIGCPADLGSGNVHEQTFLRYLAAGDAALGPERKRESVNIFEQLKSP